MAENESNLFSGRRLSIVLITLGVVLVAGFVLVSQESQTGGQNFATIQTAGPSTSVHNLFGVNQTVYCTGITSRALKLRSPTPRIKVSFLFKINDQNVTGQFINVIPEITTNASLRRTFGVGACDRCGGNLSCPHPTGFDAYTQLQPSYFPVTNVYFATIGVQSGPPLGSTFGPAGVTVYAYLDIQAITTDVKTIISQNTQPPSLLIEELV